jgi:hypothetical protein
MMMIAMTVAAAAPLVVEAVLLVRLIYHSISHAVLSLMISCLK